MFIRWILLTILFLVLAACAKPPQFELETTEHVLGQARQLGAEQYAPTEYLAAQSALQDGQAQMAENKFRAARETLALALEHARRAVVVTQETRAKETAELARLKAEAEEALLAAEKARIRAEEARRAASKAEAKLATEEAARKQTETAAKTAPVKKVDEYKVGEGENLWTISAQPTVYADGHLWPLLYQANRDQIKDPRQIFPGQMLSIRRDITPEEIEEARQKAMASDIFPVSER